LKNIFLSVFSLILDFKTDLSINLIVGFPVQFVGFPVQFVGFPVQFVGFPVQFVGFRYGAY
jgi:hypothetical protein